MKKPLTLETVGDTHLVITRGFQAPPERLYRAHTEPELIQQWMTGPDGWRMSACLCEAHPGGAIRYEWADGSGNGFHITGQFLALEPHKRIVHVERMHMPDPTPDNRVETRFEGDGGGGTLMTIRMTLPDEKMRAAMLESGFDAGMEISYQRLEGCDFMQLSADVD